MAKVLVTGANGFVGHHLIKELVDNGYGVLGIGGSHHHAADKPSPLADEAYKVVDLMDAEAVSGIDFSGIDAIIHLAGLAAPGPSFDQPMLYLNTNVGIEVNLFEAALKQGVKPRCLVISSGHLYDAGADMPLTERSPVLPNSPYSVSKIAQEEMAYYYRCRGFEVIVVRPFNHIGPGQGPGFLVPDLAKQIIEAEQGGSHQITVGNLDAKRDYTDVRDIVRAYRLLLEKGRPGELYNLCSGRPLSGHEILDGLSKAASIELTVKQDEAKLRPSDTPLLVGSYDKLAQDTGWQPEIPLERTFQDVIADWRNQLK